MKKIILFAIVCASMLFAGDFSWPVQTTESKPWTRWWWHGCAVDSINILRELNEFKKCGLGGVEITFIYAVQNNDQHNRRYLSPEFRDILSYTLESAHALGLKVDLPMGTGWRNGGPWIKPEHADSRLVVETASVNPGKTYEHDFLTRPVRILKTDKDGQRTLLETAKKFTFTNNSSRAVTLYFAMQSPSGAKVKRPSPGGEGFAFNPFSLESSKISLEPFQALFSHIPTDYIRCQFHDSYEYTGNWSNEIFSFFQNKYKYNLAEYLPELSGHGDQDSIQRIKCDYRDCLSEMLQQHFLTTWKETAENYNHQIRNQGHGSPANLLDVYALADIPETEIFAGDQNSNVLKFAASAAHITGRNLVSAESFTWQDEHFNVTLDSMKISADLLFTSGINHVFYHGTAYSPENVEWPGWLFYASTQINSRNPIWLHLPKFNSYISRCQSFLQQGSADNDVLIYWPVYDEWMQQDGMMKKLTVHDNSWITRNPAGLTAAQLDKQGFLYDFISDKQIKELIVKDGVILAPGNTYQSIVIPDCHYIPNETVEKLLALSSQGAWIFFHTPIHFQVPGFYNYAKRQHQLDVNIKSILQNTGKGRFIHQWDDFPSETSSIAELDMRRKGLSVFRRKDKEGNAIYFIVNKSGNDFDKFVQTGKKLLNPVLFNPMTGQYGAAQTWADSQKVRLQLFKNESIILTEHAIHNDREYPYQEKELDQYSIEGTWTITFETGGPKKPPVQQMDSLQSWTCVHPKAEMFCGKAIYDITFNAPNNEAGCYLLDLGRVCESASVRLNGQVLDTLITAPFQIPLNNVKSFKNHLELAIVNLAANRIRDLDRKKVEWRIFEDINFVNKDYKAFDASEWPIRQAGLLGPVTLKKVATGPQNLE